MGVFDISTQSRRNRQCTVAFSRQIDAPKTVGQKTLPRVCLRCATRKNCPTGRWNSYDGGL